MAAQLLALHMEDEQGGVGAVEVKWAWGSGRGSVSVVMKYCGMLAGRLRHGMQAARARMLCMSTWLRLENSLCRRLKRKEGKGRKNNPSSGKGNLP